MAIQTKPPLELHIVIRKPDGRSFRWDANDRRTENRPLGVECGSKLMEGFADAKCDLPRRPDQEYPDLGLYDDARFEGLDGQIAYEGRGDGFPGDVSEDTRRVGVRALGWMTHARDRPMPPVVYVDRDISQWGPASTARKNSLTGVYGAILDGQPLPDSGRLHQSFQNSTISAGFDITTESWYYRAADIGSIYYDPDPTAVSLADANYALVVGVSTDGLTETQSTGDLQPAGGAAGTFDSTADGRKYGFVYFRYSPGAGQWRENAIDWALVVFGRQGLTKRGVAPSQGYLVSDMLVDAGRRFAPLLDYSQVVTSEFVVQQAVAEELTDPYDFWLDLNRWEMRHLAVWEDRKLYFDPFDYESVDWRVRTDEDGVRVRHAGPATGRTANGVMVRYQDVSTMRSTVITPDDNPLLADTDPTLPANVAGVDAWETIQMPDPDSASGAVRYGQLALRQLNKQRAPTRVTIKGHIRDDARHWHQGWLPRANQTVLLENEENAVPRMIHEARWNAETQTATLSLDAESESIDAILDKLLTETKMARQR